MVGVIILYDHVHPVGAFAKKAAIDVREGGSVWRESVERECGGCSDVREGGRECGECVEGAVM